MIWYLCGCKRTWEPLQWLFTVNVSGYGKNKKSESKTPCSASGEIFLGKPLDKRSEVCYSYAPEEERTAGQTPDVLDIPTNAPRIRGAVTEATWKLPLHDGAGGCPVKAGWSTLKTEHR